MAERRCQDCGSSTLSGRSLRCEACKRQVARARTADWQRRNRERYNARMREWYASNREAFAARTAAWRAANPEKVAAYKAAQTAEQRRNYSLRSRFGITLDDQHEMLARQGGLCGVCGCCLDAKNLAVDHDHETGEVRGLLCRGCNVGLGAFESDPMLLQVAFSYLTATERPWLPQRLQERKAQ